MDYQAAAAKYGTVEHNGQVLALTQEAYAGNHGTGGGVRYYASAIDAGGGEYLVAWDTTAAWDAATEEARAAELAATNSGAREVDYQPSMSLLEDESNACDWESPAEIKAL